MESQVLDLSVPSRKRANSNKSNFDDFSDSDSSRSSSPLDNERCPSQQYIRHCSSMRLPTRVKSRTDWSGQSDDGLDTSPPEVIHDDRVPDDKSIFRNYQYSPMKMSSQGYEVTESPFQRYGTLKWIQQSQENFHESIYNFEQFTYDSKMGRSPEQTDARPFMYNSALDLSSSSKKVEVSLNRGFTNSAPELRTTPLVNKSKMGLGHMPCVYQSAEKAGKIEASMKEEQASPSPPNHPSPSPDLEPTISKKVDGITVTLHDSNLWNTFRKHGTEMIINRNGR
ncbi:hypothetical protein LOTGIDRAFT_176571 [Lottia gigantea]|uniref:T-box domain-containing protein n=1 Tax=Lottia gigantea TaxID=225164 RepID=V4AI99_LOTGI|nr:hypothetical protein LOTGIDRAFT_176571 [Lottia gigantea]ESO96667.1 hypothetical protein LOTGIDRAFT_176571 [Lottia gigantea]